MKKTDLCPGTRYLRKRKTVIDGTEREAKRWVKCERVKPSGAVFSREFEPEFDLTNRQINEELFTRWD